MKHLKIVFNEEMRKALDAYHYGFLNVLATIQGQGVDLAKDGAKTLGMSKNQYRQRCVDLADMLWRDTLHIKQMPDGKSKFHRFWDYASNLSNAHEALEVTGLDMKSDAGFAPLQTTKLGFESEARIAVESIMKSMQDYAQSSDSGGTIVYDEIIRCMKVAGMDSDSDQPYQDAGYASKDEFLKKLDGWKQAANERKSESGHSCCGGHSHAPEPTPSS